jgi:protein-tyrosine phosphatase
MSDSRPSHPYRVTVVCLGNICRSPIGEAVLRARIEEAGLADRVVVDSAGTGDWHLGQGANPRAVAVLDAAGYPNDHTARQITPEWFDGIDLVLAMDEANYADLARLLARSGASTELRMLRSFDPDLAHLPEPHPDLVVPDPYYGTDQDFVDVLHMVEKASGGVVSHAAAAS